MSKMLPIDSINQNLNALSLNELLEVRAKIDALIAQKSLEINKVKRILDRARFYSSILKSTKSTLVNTTVINQITDIDVFSTVPPSSIPLVTTFVTEHNFLNEHNEYQVFQSSEQVTNRKDNSLEMVINLVDEWINDESGYDEKVYPQIEESLKQNRISL